MPSRLAVVLVSLLLATPALIFWLWLVILPASVVKLCPEGCICDPGGYNVDCTTSSLNNIPLIFPTNAQELVILANKITSLEKDSFVTRGLTELEYLTVDDCELERIEVGAFNGLTKLKYLEMPSNKISEITPGTFAKMNCLEYLDLAFNRIEHLDVDIFSGLINLQYIALERNKLQHLHPDTFAGLPNLEQLRLPQNPSLQIPTDRHFISSHSLSHLDISRCSVSTVSVETFANVTALERLDLSWNNNLRSVDINILKALPKLSALYLYGNPLQCDCQLQEVWRWCQDHNIRTVHSPDVPRCATPSEVRGMRWGVLEKGQCLEDNIHYYGDYKNISYSYTSTEDLDWRFLKAVQVPVYVFLFIFGTIGNVIILIIITRNKDMRTVPNMYILNLVISDMIYLVVQLSQFYGSREFDQWKSGDFMCRFLSFCSRLSVSLSAYSVAVLSIQRYRVIVNPLHVRASSQQTWRATWVTICGVWIVAALFAIPSALSERLCDFYQIYSYVDYYKNVVLFELLVSCVLPLCVTAFSYIMTARHLVKSAQPISEETQTHQTNTRKNTAKIVVGLTVVFLISYVPYHIFWTYIISNETSYFYYGHISPTPLDEVQHTYLVSRCLLLINPCLNPVALFCTGRAFRRQFKRYLTCCCKASPPGTNFELTRRH